MSDDIILLPTKEILEGVRKELGLDEQRVKKAVDGLKTWLRLQPHLPEGEDDARLERWLIRCKNNMETTKQTLDMYYSIRTHIPELMCGWDVNQPWMDTACSYAYFCIMPELTPQYDRVIVAGLSSKDCGDDFNVWDLFKGLLLANEVRICEDYYLKEVIVFDFKNITLNHIKRIPLPAMKKLTICAFKGYKFRVKAVHFINLPTYAEALLAVILSLAKKKIAQRIQIHGTDFTELYKKVPRRYLPKDLGGECSTIEQLFAMSQKKLRSYRDWFVSREQLKADESKRPNGKLNSGDLFGIEGSFRQLNID